MKNMHLVPFEAAALTGKVGLEALMAPIMSRQRSGVAPSDTIAAVLSRHEVPRPHHRVSSSRYV